jgi:(+)-trans-carveol dehydrogenase
MDLGISGRVAVVTGASRGIGAAVARLLHERGANLGLASRGGDDLGLPGVVALPCDVRDPAALARLCDATAERFGGIDILVANAGGATNAPAWELTEADWDFVHEVCLKSVFLTTRAVIPHMMERRAGKIVLTASRNGLRVEHGYAHYNAAKAGVIQYGKSLALELGPYEINVNVICPTQMADKSRVPQGNVEAQKYWDQVAGHPGATYEDFDAASGRDNLFERGGQPDYREVAEGVLWLVNDRARLVTGLALPMDAGWIVKRGG